MIVHNLTCIPLHSDMTAREPVKPESPHDDGYETGVAVNGHAPSNAAVAGVGAPPTAPKPGRPSNGSHRGGGGGGKPSVSRLVKSSNKNCGSINSSVLLLECLYSWLLFKYMYINVVT